MSFRVLVETAGKKESKRARERESGRKREREREREEEGRKRGRVGGVERERCVILLSPLEMLDLCSSTPHTLGDLIAVAFVIL